MPVFAAILPCNRKSNAYSRFNEALPANATVECDAVPAADILTASDNCGTATVTMTETRDNGDCLNRYTLTRTWTAVDECSNETIDVQTIAATDDTDPTVTCNPSDNGTECIMRPTTN